MAFPFSVLLILVALFPLASAQTETFPLPKGFQPEGITKGTGNNLYVSNFRNGGIIRINARTNKTSILVKPFRTGRIAIGMWVQGKKLFVAGGGAIPIGSESPGFFHVYNLKTGKQIVSCRVPGARFLNDVIVISGKAYFTDSGSRNLVVVPLKKLRKCKFSFSRLPTAFSQKKVVRARANGIEVYRGRLLVANFDEGSVYVFDLKKRERSRALFPAGMAEGADGLVVRGNKLYVIGNTANAVTVWKLRVRSNGKLVASLVKTIEDPTFNSPATGTILGDSLYVTNARFADFSPDDDISKEPFTLSIIPRV